MRPTESEVERERSYLSVLSKGYYVGHSVFTELSIGIMSGLDQIAGASSFFPTAKELSSGVQWFREHPVLATAAATAVSVLTYWNATANAVEQLEEHHVQEEEPPKSNATRKPRLHNGVSWCDEHGGSLTEVFEHLELDEQVSQDEDEKMEEPVADLISYKARPGMASHASLECGLNSKAGADANVSRPGSDDQNTESPQWGWYVAITPPQDPSPNGTHPDGNQSPRVASGGREELPQLVPRTQIHRTRPDPSVPVSM